MKHKGCLRAFWFLAAGVGFSLSTNVHATTVSARPTPMQLATVSPEQIQGRFKTKEDLRDALCLAARKMIGTPYVLGDDGKVGYDCSSFVREVYRRQGIELPRLSVEQFFAGRPADPFHLRGGDLVFFATTRWAPSHVGVYVGDGEFIHAPGEGKVVKVTPMSATYYRQRFTGAVDVVGD